MPTDVEPPYQYQYVPSQRDVIWWGGKGAKEWHTPDYQEDKHYVTKCGLRFVLGLEPRPGAGKYPICMECHK
jgi:hypothetical protein